MSDLPSSESPQGYAGLAYFVPYNRSIGGIIAEVTLEETHRDDITVTEHPVEQGAPIGDHAFKRPVEVTIRVGWSAQKHGDIADTGMYGILLSWQAAFNPFEIYTGKRKYSDMLISSITVTTDSHSENNLIATVVCRQVIIVATETTQASISSDPTSHATPSNTAPSIDKGQEQVFETDNAVGAAVASSINDSDYTDKNIDFSGPDF